MTNIVIYCDVISHELIDISKFNELHDFYIDFFKSIRYLHHMLKINTMDIDDFIGSILNISECKNIKSYRQIYDLGPTIINLSKNVEQIIRCIGNVDCIPWNKKIYIHMKNINDYYFMVEDAKVLFYTITGQHKSHII